jgi:hypothetical protein
LYQHGDLYEASYHFKTSFFADKGSLFQKSLKKGFRVYEGFQKIAAIFDAISSFAWFQVQWRHSPSPLITCLRRLGGGIS